MLSHANLTKLLDALRCGAYKQGYNTLCKLDPEGLKRCTLGVACEVARQNGVDICVFDNGGFRYYDGDKSLLPQAVAYWFGLDNVQIRRIAWANDYCNGGFSAAIVVIESILKGH